MSRTLTIAELPASTSLPTPEEIVMPVFIDNQHVTKKISVSEIAYLIARTVQENGGVRMVIESNGVRFLPLS